MKSRNRLSLLSLDLNLAHLTVDLEALLLLWLLESLSLEQLLAMTMVVVLAVARSLTAPSSCRRSPS